MDQGPTVITVYHNQRCSKSRSACSAFEPSGVDCATVRYLDTLSTEPPSPGPSVVFDNRIDQTSFLRADPADWDPENLVRLHTALARSFAELK